METDLSHISLVWKIYPNLAHWGADRNTILGWLFSRVDKALVGTTDQP